MLQDIYLTEDDGHEHAVNLSNFDISCRPGHKLTLLSLEKGGSSTYFHAYDHNLRKHYEADGAISGRMFPKILHFLAIVIWAWIVWSWANEQPEFDGFETLAATFIGTCIGLLVCYVAAKILAGIRSVSLRGNSDLKAYIKQLN